MNLLVALVACICLVPQDAQKPEPPPEKATNGLELEIRGLGSCPVTLDERLENMAKALELGQQASDESDNTKAWALYRAAIDNANAAGEARISHEFAREMADRWEVPEGFLPDWHLKAIQLTSNEARISELAIASSRERRHQGRTPGRGFRVILAPILEQPTN